MGSVRLQPLDAAGIDALTQAAVAGADPGEVMPPVAGPPGWTAERVEAFKAFHRQRAAQPGVRTYLIAAAGAAAGSIRLDDIDDTTAEIGLWLTRDSRGHGIGTTAVGLVLAQAKELGITNVIADTAVDNLAAQTAMRRNGGVPAEQDGRIHARFPVD